MPYRKLFSASTSYTGADIPSWEGLRSTSDVTRINPDGSLDLRDGSFDAVLSFEVLEHMPAPEIFLREAHRLLSPKGFLLVSTPFLYREHGTPNDYRRFTQHGMRLFLEQGGFEITAFVKTGTGLALLLAGLSSQVQKIPNIGGVGRACKVSVQVLINLTFLATQRLRASNDSRINAGQTEFLNLVVLAKKKP